MVGNVRIERRHPISADLLLNRITINGDEARRHHTEAPQMHAQDLKELVNRHAPSLPRRSRRTVVTLDEPPRKVVLQRREQLTIVRLYPPVERAGSHRSDLPLDVPAIDEHAVQIRHAEQVTAQQVGSFVVEHGASFPAEHASNLTDAPTIVA